MAGRTGIEKQGMVTLGEMETILREQGLLKAITVEGQEKGERIRQISWLTCDSREVRPGTLFICKGTAFRPEYLQEAARRGCLAYISERVMETDQKLTGLIVSDIRKTMAVVAAAFFGYEPGKPKLTGITGTKGKTTTAWYLKAMLDEWQKELGQPETGLISTVETYDGVSREEAVLTTPEAPLLHRLLANGRKAGLNYMTMEVSSQALKYKRVRGLQFQVGIFLNISEDHISPQEHLDFADYFNSKLAMLRQTETACVNLDAEHAGQILKAARKAKQVITFGKHPKADLRYGDVRSTEDGVSFRVNFGSIMERFTLAMRGRFNIENAMAAIAAGRVYGVPVRCMKKALAETQVPGRMETFYSRDGMVCGIVDFAHNRLSFERLFDAAYQEYGKYSRIITVFGCPGGKALNRRRELGILAGLFSDYVFLTSDDAGTESPEKISEEIRSYVEMTGCSCSCVTERRTAVQKAGEMARGGKVRTLILLLGRGSQKYQKIGTKNVRYPMDAELMKEMLITEKLE